MKNVNFEGSMMAGVNLRVATLKNSNLRNCDLRGAILAGTDLEVRAYLLFVCGSVALRGPLRPHQQEVQILN